MGGRGGGGQQPPAVSILLPALPTLNPQVRHKVRPKCKQAVRSQQTHTWRGKQEQSEQTALWWFGVGAWQQGCMRASERTANRRRPRVCPNPTRLEGQIQNVHRAKNTSSFALR
jgi:hypothetical protein